MTLTLKQAEERVKSARNTVADLLAEYAAECSFETKPHAHPANHDVWVIVRANVQALRTACDQFLKATAKEFE